MDLYNNKIHESGELIDDEKLYDMFMSGQLKEEILQMLGVDHSEKITLERVYANAKVYRASIEENGKQRSAYIKTNSLLPDIFAKELLDGTGIIIPRVKNVEYVGASGHSEYGIMQDIAEAKDVSSAISIRSIARNKEMSELIRNNFDEFCKLLGSVFETCRALGIQDRYDRNVYVIKKNDGNLAIGLIDLDLVVCYPDPIQFSQSFAAQLGRILHSLDFAFTYGEEVRQNPQGIREVVQKDSEKIFRVKQLRDNAAKKFIEGVKSRNETFKEQREQEKIKLKMKQYHGFPVGLGYSGAAKDRIIRFAKAGAELRTRINGQAQELIEEGSNAGRFIFDWKTAWDNGFLRHMRQSVLDFWASKGGPLTDAPISHNMQTAAYIFSI
jgi:hypothetical protein